MSHKCFPQKYKLSSTSRVLSTYTSKVERSHFWELRPDFASHWKCEHNTKRGKIEHNAATFQTSTKHFTWYSLRNEDYIQLQLLKNSLCEGSVIKLWYLSSLKHRANCSDGAAAAARNAVLQLSGDPLSGVPAWAELFTGTNSQEGDKKEESSNRRKKS